MLKEVMRAVALELLYREHVKQATPHYAMNRERFGNYRMTHYRGWPSCDWPRECNVYVPGTMNRRAHEQVPFSVAFIRA